MWWKLCKVYPRLTGQCKLLMKVIYGAHNFISGTNRKASNTHLCNMCDRNEYDTLEHMLFSCPTLEDQRCLLWHDVEKYIPRGLLYELNRLNTKDKTVLLLSGFNSGYIHEWDDLYVSTLMFIFKLLQIRYKCYHDHLHED